MIDYTNDELLAWISEHAARRLCDGSGTLPCPGCPSCHPADVRPYGARERLPDERPAITRHAEMTDDHGVKYDFYVSIGFYPDGRIGEVFLREGKAGELRRGMLDAFATAASMLIQCGGAQAVVDKFEHTSFEPSGRTNDPGVPRASSPIDWVCKRLKLAMGLPVHVHGGGPKGEEQ